MLFREHAKPAQSQLQTGGYCHGIGSDITARTCVPCNLSMARQIALRADRMVQSDSCYSFHYSSPDTWLLSMAISEALDECRRRTQR